MDWTSFLFGILADETLRRLVLPFLRRRRTRERAVAALWRMRAHPFGRGRRNQVAGELVGALCGELEAGKLGPVDHQARAALERHLACHRRMARAGVAGAGFEDLALAFGAPPEAVAAYQWKNGDRRGAVTTIAKAAAAAASTDGDLGFSLNPMHALRAAGRLAVNTNPLVLQARLARRLMKRRRGGGGGGDSAPDGENETPPTDGGDADSTTEGLGMLQSPNLQHISYMSGDFSEGAARPALLGHHLRRRARDRRAAMLGFSLRNLARRGAAAGAGVASSGAGKLLVSAVPGGATAVQAHAIASKALKTGDLKPHHLRAAASLAKAGRAGDDRALVKIAKIRQQAATGDKHAEKALDTIKLAHCLQTGGRCAPGMSAGQKHLATLDEMASRGRHHTF